MAKELISEMLIQCHKEGRKEGRKTTEPRQSCKHCVDNELIQYKKNSKEKYTLVHLMLNVIVKSIMLQKFLFFFFFGMEGKVGISTMSYKSIIHPTSQHVEIKVYCRKKIV